MTAPREQTERLYGLTPAMAWGVAAVGGVFYLLRWQTLLWGWAAMAAWLWAVPVLWRELQRRMEASVWDGGPLCAAWERWGAYLMVTGVLVVAMWPIPAGVMPISQDHANHYLATHIFVYDMVPQGRLFGWTDRISSGLPFGDVYGTLAYLVTGALTLVSFGWIPLSVSYAVGIFFVWWLPTMAVVAWTRRLVPGVWPAVLAGCLMALDPGGDREGGWNYSMFHGVWPQFLATGAWLWSLLSLYRLVEKQTWRRLGAAALITGLALWAHPMNAINLLVAAVLLVVLLWLERGVDEEVQRVHRGGLWCVIALAVGGLIGMIWISHLFVAAPYMVQIAAYWRTLSDLMFLMLQGRLFDYQIVAFGLLGVVGAVVAWRQQHRLGVFALVLCALLLVIGSMEPILAMDLGVHPRNGLFMFRRLSVSVKPFWFVFAGMGLSILLAGARALVPSRPVSGPARVVLVLAMAPVLWSLLGTLPRLIEAPTARPLTAQNAGLDRHLETLRAAMKAERQHFPGKPLRLIQWRSGGGSYGLLLVADEGWSSLPIHPPPCQAFKHPNARPDYGMLRWLGATHVLSYVSRRLPYTRLVVKAGRFHLYRITEQPTYPYRLEGPGKVEVVSWSAMKRVFKLSGVTEKSRLVVGIPPYRKWWAKQNGTWRHLRVYAHRRFRFSYVSSLKDGTLAVVYRDTVLEKSFGWLGLGMLLLTLWWIGRGQRPLPGLFPAWSVRWVGRVTAWAMLLGLAGLLVAGLISSHVALRVEYGERGFPHVVDVLHRQTLQSIDYGPKPYCVRPFDRSAHPECHESKILPQLRPGPQRGNKVPACLRFGVPKRGWMKMTFSVSSGARLLKGRFHWMHNRVDRFFVIGTKRHKVPNGNVFRFPIPSGVSKVKLVVRNRSNQRLTCMELVTLRP